MKDKKEIQKKIEEIVSPIFEKTVEQQKKDKDSPQELSLSKGINSMTTTPSPLTFYFRPNNYRRKIKIKNKGIVVPKEINPAIFPFPVETKFISHTKLHFIRIKNENITIQIGKNSVTGIYSQPKENGKKKIYEIRGFSRDEIDHRIDTITNTIKNKIDKYINKVVDALQIKTTQESPVWDRYEDFIKGEEYIDSLPQDLIIHDTHFKKVYGEGIEFKRSEKAGKPASSVKNYIASRALERFAPEIADAITHHLKPAIMALTEQIEVHLDVQKRTQKNLKKMEKTLDRLNNTLSQKTINDFR